MRNTGHAEAGAGVLRPYTLISCATCGDRAAQGVMSTLRQAVRECPHGVMVVTQCLGSVLDCTAGRGAHFIVQPCTEGGAPSAAALPLGPVASAAEAEMLRAWLMEGALDAGSLPSLLRASRAWRASGT